MNRAEASRELFSRALELQPHERTGFVRAQSPDDELAREVLDLLRYHDADETFLERSAMVDAGLKPALPLSSEPAAKIGERVGRYQIMRVIGEGGMGVVYEAEQDAPRRAVALKLIRPGLVSVSMLHRFAKEAAALGKLQHPGIAQIYEAGTAEDSGKARPYLAMELVIGRAITSYAQEKDLGTRARMDLFARVCDAVQHAHDRGVIHRDLKPGNVLVTPEGQPKILDFGIARITDSGSTMTTVRTDVGQLLGTLAYMSPEQASGETTRVDSRSDVYALGVILYELLAGKPPVNVAGLPMMAALRAIREDEPTPLSSFDRIFRGDVETIVGRALEKDPQRRYPTAREFAEDIRSYLGDEPIVARRPSTLYQFSKFARRNRGVVVGVAGVFVALAAGFVVTSLLLSRAIKAESAARAETRAAIAYSEFFRQMLSTFDPDTLQGKNLDVFEQMIDQGWEASRTVLANEPGVRAEAQQTIADVYIDLGLLSKADAALREAQVAINGVDPTGPIAARILISQGARLDAVGELERSVQEYSRAVELLEARVDPTADLLQNARMGLAMSLVSAGGERHMERADAVVEQVARVFAARPPSEELTANLEMIRGMLRRKQNRFDEAIASYERALELRRARFGQRSVRTATVELLLARAYFEKGDRARAEPMFREGLALRREFLGPNHPALCWPQGTLARLLWADGRFEEAEALLRDVQRINLALSGPDHMSVVDTHLDLAEMFQGWGRGDAARQELDAARGVLARSSDMGDPSRQALVRRYDGLAASLETGGSP